MNLDLPKDKCNVEYWNGAVELIGKKNGENWEIRFDIPEFCFKMRDFLDFLGEEVDLHKFYNNY